MAITEIEYTLISQMKENGLLPTAPHVLELGEANWYGDVPLRRLYADISRLVESEDERGRLQARMKEIAQQPDQVQNAFDIAKVFYQVFFAYESLTAIDLNGTDVALRLNLNEPVDLGKQFDFVMNAGTAEHVFNVFQFFQNVHDLTIPGGLMVHGMPFTGWYDHGFYNFNPTFFFDLAVWNNYELLVLLYAEFKPLKILQIMRREQVAEMATQGQFGSNSLIFGVYRKPAEARLFVAPMQGYYAGTVSDEVRAAWRELR